MDCDPNRHGQVREIMGSWKLGQAGGLYSEQESGLEHRSFRGAADSGNETAFIDALGDKAADPARFYSLVGKSDFDIWAAVVSRIAIGSSQRTPLFCTWRACWARASWIFQSGP